MESQGHAVDWLNVDEQGEIDLDHLRQLLARASRPELVSVMSANNETGVIQPIAEVASICADAGVPLHVDATQTIGKLPLSLTSPSAQRLFPSPRISFMARPESEHSGLPAASRCGRSCLEVSSSWKVDLGPSRSL